jgi:DNA helicase II / ATP-dependent DNA helicase PcrA
MTMHAAKGLEFPLVVIAGLEQGLFPLSKAETDVQEQEEERRLFYVGITRAREQLILSYAERRYRFGELVFNRPSMFLSEIDSEAFTSSSRSFASTSPTRTPPANQPRKQRPARSDYSQLPRAESYSQIDAPSLKVGQRVKHPMFGAGTILSVGGSGQGAKATVEFSNGQRKQLMLAYARLEVL